jgi:predicted transcriptional regulator
MKKEPNILEIKAHYQFWRDRYEQTKSVKDLINMQNHLQQYLRLVNEQKADKDFLIDEGNSQLKKEREESLKREAAQRKSKLSVALKTVEEYMKNSEGQHKALTIAKQYNLPYTDVTDSLDKLEKLGMVKKTKIKGVRNYTISWERCDD